MNIGGEQISWGSWGRLTPGAQSCCSPQRSSQPPKGWDGPKRLYNAITRDRGYAHPPSASRQVLAPLWSRGAPTLCLLLADTASHGVERSSRAGKANQSQTSPPAFPPTFLGTASLRPHLTPIPRWPQLLQVAKPQWVFAWLGAQSCSLGGDQHCSHPALLLREGKQSSIGHGRELGPASGCESQHWDAWIPLLPEVPQGHSTLTVSSCPCSAAESRDRHWQLLPREGCVPAPVPVLDVTLTHPAPSEEVTPALHFSGPPG